MKHTNNSIFTRVLALVLCLVTVAGLMTACFQDIELNEGIGSTSGESTTKPGVTTTKPSTTTKPTTGTTTGDVAGNDPIEDPVDPDEIYSASTSLAEDALIFGTLASDVVIGGEDGVGAILPADVKVAEGASALSLSVKKAETGSEINLGEGDVAHSLDVHIDGIAADNTVPMIVNLGAVLAIGLENTELKLYHIEGGVAVLMTRVDSIDEFAIHNQYTYNAETGEVSIYVASFSVFSMVSTAADKWDGTYDISWYDAELTTFTLDTAEEFAGFRAIVDGGYYTVADGVWTWNETVQDNFDGKTVKLGKDINLMNILFDPIGFGYESDTNKRVFRGTFDGQGYSIYNLKQNGWELDPNPGVYDTYTYSTAGAGLFASIVDAEIKNLIINGAEIVYECVDMGIVVGYAYGTCNFENIIVTNSKIANYNRYTGGVVGEVNGTHTFSNIIVDTSVKISSLWGSFDTSIGGVIGGKWGDAAVTMTDVTVGCELDVFSDVTSAYQWYAYRRCGMLIGYTEQESPKHAELADASFLTCENVKVYYGDWTTYDYYEFADQESATGRRYPWVRAQAGEHNAAFSNPRYGVPTFEGVPVDANTAETLKSRYVQIPFNQLYGGGQGVYGQATHDGVTLINKFETTIYFKNAFKWDDVKIYYWYEDTNNEDVQIWHNTAFPGVSMELLGYDGTYEYYKFVLPVYVDGFIISGEKNNGTGDREQTRDISALEVYDNVMFSPQFVQEGQSLDVNLATFDGSLKLDGYYQLYFKPHDNWYSDSARFAVYAFKGSSTTWYDLTDKYSNGIYKLWVSKSYSSVIVCRMNPSAAANNWDNKWNQTIDLAIPTDGKNLYTITNPWNNSYENKGTGSWSKK